jgi:hypothetical protein
VTETGSGSRVSELDLSERESGASARRVQSGERIDRDRELVPAGRQRSMNSSRGEIRTEADHDSGGRRPGRRTGGIRPFLPLLVGILLGAALGALGGVLAAPEPSAVARIEVRPDQSLPTGGEFTSDPDRFTQGEALVLSGDDLKAAAALDTGSDNAPQVTATQVGKTNVIEIVVAAVSAPVAVSSEQNLITTYQQRRRAALDARITAASSVVDAQLRTLGASGPSSRGDGEYARLLGLRNQLQLAGQSDQDQVVVIDPPRAAEQSRVAAAIRGVLIGVVLGGLVGLLVKLLLDRTRRTGSGRRDER